MKTLVLFTALLLIGCENETQTDKAIFVTENLPNGLVRTTVIPDGNTWTTTKDSVNIYIENY